MKSGSELDVLSTQELEMAKARIRRALAEIEAAGNAISWSASGSEHPQGSLITALKRLALARNEATIVESVILGKLEREHGKT